MIPPQTVTKASPEEELIISAYIKDGNLGDEKDRRTKRILLKTVMEIRQHCADVLIGELGKVRWWVGGWWWVGGGARER